MPDFCHFLLTRFNVRLRPDDPRTVPSDQWFEARIRLFEKYCLPSVLAQIEPNFTWLVFFDERTPLHHRTWISQLADISVIAPIFVSFADGPAAATAVSDRLENDSQYVVTTRLDNDDVISSDFTDRVQGEFRHQDLEVVNFPHGYAYKDGHVFTHTDFSNPFATLIERRSGFRTVWGADHDKLSSLAPIRQVVAPPVWMQVIHGRNISNRVRGRIVAHTDLGGFRAVSSLAASPPSFHRIVFDWVLLVPLRTSRDLAIRLGKRILSALGIATVARWLSGWVKSEVTRRQGPTR